MARFRARISAAPSGRNLTPLSARGIRARMIIALKIRALRMALCGDADQTRPWISFVPKIDGFVTRTEVVHLKQAPHVLLGGFVIFVELDRLSVILFRFVVVLSYLGQDTG